MAEPKEKKRYFSFATFLSVTTALVVAFILCEVLVRRGTDAINNAIDKPKNTTT